MKKFICFFIFLSIFHYIFSQNDDYLKLYNEIYNQNIFCSPVDGVVVFNDNYHYGFGYKLSINDDEIYFSDSSIILGNENQDIYSICDGEIIHIEILYSSCVFLVIKNNDYEIEYIGINIDEKLKIGDNVEKGQLLGKLYFLVGRHLILRIKYKNYYFDPYLLLPGIKIKVYE